MAYKNYTDASQYRFYMNFAILNFCTVGIYEQNTIFFGFLYISEITSFL